jgi:hypothetical protein
MKNRYSPRVIREGAYPRPLKDSQVRGMIAVEDHVNRRNPQAVRTLTPKMVAEKRQARRIRSTKHAPR